MGTSLGGEYRDPTHVILFITFEYFIFYFVLFVLIVFPRMEFMNYDAIIIIFATQKYNRNASVHWPSANNKTQPHRNVDRANHHGHGCVVVERAAEWKLLVPLLILPT